MVSREHELDELRDQIDTLLVQARAYATRVRMQALRRAASIEEGANDAATARATGVDVSPSAAHGLAPGALPTAAGAPALSVVRDHHAAAETAAEAPGSSFGVRPAAVPLDLFEGVVQLEIGPLEDFSQLVGFEDAAEGIAAASQISVTRFSKGRATIDLRLNEPVDLLRELAQRSPVDFKVRSLRDGRLILDLEDSTRAA